MASIRCLLIDNYDSYTFNLYQYLCKVNGCEPDVIRNDQISWKNLQKIIPNYHCIVISPGPGLPSVPKDFGICADLLRYYFNEDEKQEFTKLPLFGVCLGHQGIAHYCGERVIHAPKVCHGVLSTIHHIETNSKSIHDDNTSYIASDDKKIGLFHNIPSEFKVVRYHSWIVEITNSHLSNLRATAWTEDGLVMALEHMTLPVFGVQFHPESICTEYGMRILENFREITRQYHVRKGTLVSQNSGSFVKSVIPPPRKLSTNQSKFKLLWKKIPVNNLPVGIGERIFTLLMQQNLKQDFFWLDSSKVENGLSRFSFLGIVGSSPNSKTISYNLTSRKIKIIQPQHEGNNNGNIVQELTLGQQETFFDWIEMQLKLFKLESDSSLPFDFNCGLVGCFGYEMSTECLFTPADSRVQTSANEHNSHFMMTDTVIAIDHQEQDVYMLTFYDRSKEEQEQFAQKWISETEILIQNSVSTNLDLTALVKGHFNENSNYKNVTFHLQQPYGTYTENIRSCLDNIDRGESYELCLTNKVFAKLIPNAGSINEEDENSINPFLMYHHLRRLNAAPYAAFMRFESQEDNPQYVLCSSPERFLKIDRSGYVESKPIKGTRKRSQDPEEDNKIKMELASCPKDFSENLMIVDLIRNDLGKVCQSGSVHVPKLMSMRKICGIFLPVDVETYATVHQLVTTVGGTLRADLTAVECVRQSFPPGSMTGAPKYRSVKILEQLEQSPRLVYSGTLGYFGLCGACDLNVVIRTSVLNNDGLYIGCGGAIVADSDEVAEFEEMVLKAKVLLKTIVTTKNGGRFREDVPIQIVGVPDPLPPPNPAFDLLETILFQHQQQDFYLLELHLKRLERSATFFKIPFDKEEIRKKLIEQARDFQSDMRVRLTLGRNGQCNIQSTSINVAAIKEKTYRVAIATDPIHSAELFVQHKTTNRTIYEQALRKVKERFPEADDVILHNQYGEVTETCIANIAIQDPQGAWMTPPAECGLLPGVMREELLRRGEIFERKFRIADLLSSPHVKLFNSVRGEWFCKLELLVIPDDDEVF